MALSYKNDDKIDDRLSPYDDTASKKAREIRGLEDSFNSPSADSTQEDKNIDSAKSVGDRESGWKNNTTANTLLSGGSNNKVKALFTVNGLKKSGPVGFLIVLFLGGSTAILLLTTPAFLFQQLKETMFGKWNDQVAVMDIRTRAIIKNKLQDDTKRTACVKAIPICKRFRGFPDRQIKKFEKAGIKVNIDREVKIPGTDKNAYSKVTSLEFNGQTITADNIAKISRTNPEFASALARGYNPRVMAFGDNLAARFHEKQGIFRGKSITGTDEESNREGLLKSSNGQLAAEYNSGVRRDEVDCEGGSQGCVDGKRTVYYDTVDGVDKEISADKAEESFKGQQDLQADVEARKSITDAASANKAAERTAKSFLLSTAFGLGAVDGACGGYMLIRGVGTAAKVIQASAFMRYQQIFNGEADIQRQGDGDQNSATYLGNILTSTNANGESFGDSVAYRYAAYDDVPNIDSTDGLGELKSNNGGATVQLTEKQATQTQINAEYTSAINGPLVSTGTMATIINLVAQASRVNATAKAADKACGFITGKTGQAIILSAAALGVVAAFFSGGSTVLVGAAQSIAVSYFIGKAVGALVPKLAEMAAGKVITGFENGPAALNKVGSGTAAYTGGLAAARGIPALKKDDAVDFERARVESNTHFAMIDRHDKSPFDITSKNTWLGNVAFRMLPYTGKFATMKNISFNSGLSTITGLTSSSFSSLLPTTNAASLKDQFSVCADPDYNDLGLAADPFCNLRHGLPDDILNIDTELIREYMFDNNYIGDDGKPADENNDYAKWIEKCTERTTPIGSPSDEGGTDVGQDCVLNSNRSAEENKKFNYFSVYFVDDSIQDGMDTGLVSSAPSTDTGATGTTDAAGTSATGDSKVLAQQLLDSPNIQFQVDSQRTAMEYIARTGRGTACGGPAISPKLLGVMVTASQKYKITIGVVNAGHSCTTKSGNPSKHGSGFAIDINGVSHLNQPFMSRISFTPAQTVMAKEFAEYLDSISPGGRGVSGAIGLGQSQCYGGNPPNIPKIQSNRFFRDPCNHMHIDVNP